MIESVAKGRWEARGCEACHGTGGEHSETMEPGNILGFKSEFTDDANRACPPLGAPAPFSNALQPPTPAESR